MRKLLAMVCCSGALLLGSEAVGSSAEIVGTIVNPAGAPISGITVSAENRVGASISVSVTDSTGRYVINGLSPGVYILLAKGQTAVAYVGDRGITVDWGIAANSQVIAVARQGTESSPASVSARSSVKDLVAKQVGTESRDSSDNAVQRGDCAEDEDDSNENDDAEIATNINPRAEHDDRRHCKHTESD